MQNLTIIIPTLNEEGNIRNMVEALNFTYPNLGKIIVVDDGSTDKTKEIVESLNMEKVLFINRSNAKVKGLTASVCTGILNTYTEYFVVMDADFQHPINAIELIFKKLNYGGFNHLVIGKRKIIVNWPLKRKVISKVALYLAKVRLLLNAKIYPEPISGFFGGRTWTIAELIKQNKLLFQMQGYKVLFDIMKYLPRHANVDYIEYVFRDRQKGVSKIGKKHIICFLKSVLT